MVVIKPKPSSFPSEVVLVVEDSLANSVALAGLLRRLAFGVIDFKDGQEAWEWLEELPSGECSKIKAVFSDISMPKMDGLELLKRVRTRAELRSTKFVFVSAVIDPPVVREARSLSSDGYIVKPVMPSVLQKKIEELFPAKAGKLPKI